MEVKDWDVFNKTYVIGDNNNRENAGIKKILKIMKKSIFRD